MSIPYHINLTDEEERALDEIWGVDITSDDEEATEATEATAAAQPEPEATPTPPTPQRYTRRIHPLAASDEEEGA